MGLIGDAWNAAKKIPGIRIANDVLNPTFGPSDETKKAVQGDIAATRGLSSEFLDAYRGAGAASAPTMGAAYVNPVERVNGATIGATNVGAAPTVAAAQAAPATTVERTMVAPAAQATGVQLNPAATQGRTVVGPAATVDPNSVRLGPAHVAGAAMTGPAALADARAIDTTRSDQFRTGQLGLVSNLQDVVAGRAPSVAQEQLRAATDATIANARGNAVAASRGGNTALAMREMMRSQGQAQQQLAGQAALVRAQESATARGQMGDVLGSGRGQDIGIESQDAQAKNAAALANAQARNAAAATNAQLGTQANIASMNALNTQGAEDAKLRLTAQQGNQQAQQQVTTQQAALDAQQGAGNADRVNARDTQQATMDLQNRQFNTGAQNTVGSQQAAISAGAAQQDAAARNAVIEANAARQQAAATATAGNQLAIVQQAAAIEAARKQRQAELDAAAAAANATAANTRDTQNALLDQQARANNQGAAIQTHGQNLQERDSEGDRALEAQKATNAGTLSLAAIESGAQDKENAWAGGMVNQLGGAMMGGAKPPTSDRRAKKDVGEPSDRQFEELFAAIKGPKSWKYKEPEGHGSGRAPGRQYGVMAQDLEHGGPIGKSMVFADKGTKKLDPPQMLGVVMAMSKHHDDRLRRLEGKR